MLKVKTFLPAAALYFMKDSVGNDCKTLFKDSLLSLKNDALLNFY